MLYSSKPQIMLWIALGIAALATLFYSMYDPQRFTSWFAAEDGPIEYATAILLFCAACILYVLSRGLHGLSKALLMIYALAFIFAAGEEISWGQRILGIESNAFFQQNNYQGETNLHNLVVADVHLVEHIFGRGIALLLLGYLVVLPLLHPIAGWVRRLCDRLAIPVPPRYIAALAVAWSIFIASLDVGRNWEVYEFVFAVLACLIFLAPVNRATFNR